MLAAYSGDKLTILLFQKIDTAKFLWDDLGTSPPQLFGCGDDRPRGVGA